MSKKIAVLSGDGIGPEICTEAVKVMSAAAARHGSDLAFDFADFGGCAIDHFGAPFPFCHPPRRGLGRRRSAGRRGRPEVG